MASFIRLHYYIYIFYSVFARGSGQMKHYCNVSGGSLSGGLGNFGLLGAEEIIHCHVQFYSPTFRRRKSCKSRSPLKRRSESAASSPRIRLSSVMLFSSSEILYLRSQMLRTARWGWYLGRCFSWHSSTLMPCHAAVCVNFILGSKK